MIEHQIYVQKCFSCIYCSKCSDNVNYRNAFRAFVAANVVMIDEKSSLRA